MKWTKILAVLALGVAVSGGALAQHSSAGEKRKDIIVFPADEIRGGREAAGVVVIDAKPHLKSGNMIRVRDDFNDKVLQSVSEL